MKNSVQKLIQSAFFAVLVLSLSGCAEAIVEKATESAIENVIEEEGSMGDGVEVDLSNGNFEFSADGVNFQGGENTAWPENLPSDVYQIEGQVLSSMVSAEDSSYWVMLQVEMTADEAYKLYATELESEGWTSLSSGNFGETMTLSVQKDDRLLTVLITSSEGQTSVTVTEARQ